MAMQKLNVRFSDETKDYISNTGASYDITDSDIARAAMNIGLSAINKHAESVANDVLINNFVSANQSLSAVERWSTLAPKDSFCIDGDSKDQLDMLRGSE
jgi:hypothetical protein